MLNNKYDPRLKKQAELEQTLTRGEKVLEELLEELKPGKKGALSRQSWIITGARGAGKSHLLALLYHRIKQNETLSEHWWPLLFPEELFRVESLYRLLLEIFEYVFKTAPRDGVPEEFRAQFREIKSRRITGSLKRKKEAKHQLAKELFELLAKLRKATGKRFILMLENMQYLMREQLGEEDVKLLRGFMNEHPGVWVIIGTALTVFEGISDYGKPFYHFFRLRGLENLERDEIIGFLQKLAAFRGDEHIGKRIETNRKYIYLYQLLTGGNPRLVLFLYELLLDNEMLDTYMVLEKLSELTPYFLDKTRDESGQRKLILDALATEAPAQSPRDIAEYVNEDYKSILEQLKRLAAEGWVREVTISSEKSKRPEVLYSLRDYFYRIWYQLRFKGIEESEILPIAELVVFLFERNEIEERFKKALSEETRALYEQSLELAGREDFMRNIHVLLAECEACEDEESRQLVSEGCEYLASNNWRKLLDNGGQLLLYSGKKLVGYLFIAIAKEKLNEYEEAVEFYCKVNANYPKLATWGGICRCHYALGQLGAAYEAVSKGFALPKEPDINDLTIISPLLDILNKIVPKLFQSAEEVKRSTDENTSLPEKFEALCRLVLLDKTSIAAEVLPPLLKHSQLPLTEAKKLEVFFVLKMFTIQSKDSQSPRLREIFLCWVRLVERMYIEEREFAFSVLRFFIILYNLTEKVENHFEFVRELFSELGENTGERVKTIGLKVLHVLMEDGNPDCNLSEQDPLLKEFSAQLKYSRLSKAIFGNLY